MPLPRQRVDEWMDDPALSPLRHRHALAGLRRLNRISGVSGSLMRQLSRFSASATAERPLKILDVAAGSGDLPIAWLKSARAKQIPMRVTALDISDVALQTVAEAAAVEGLEIGTIRRNALRDGLPGGFDIVTCSLFMHHLDPPDVLKLIQEMWRASGRAVIICDLDRSRWNLALVAASARLVTRSDVVHFDASASVRGAYTRQEFAGLIERSLGFCVPVRRSFPCRFMAVIDQQSEVQYVSELRRGVAGVAS